MALKIFEVVQVCVCLFSHSDFLRSFDLTWLVCLIERAVSRPGPPPRLHSSIDVGFCVLSRFFALSFGGILTVEMCLERTLPLHVELGIMRNSAPGHHVESPGHA